VTARIEHRVDGAVHADLALHGLRDARIHATLNRRLTRLLLANGQIYLAGHGAAGTSRQPADPGHGVHGIASGSGGAAAGLAGAQLRRQIDFDHAGYLHPTVGTVAASAMEELKG